MDFFEHQDKARKRTGHLVLLFCLGLFATLAAVNLACFLLYWFFYNPDSFAMAVPASNTQAPFTQWLSGTSGSNAFETSQLSRAWSSWWYSNLNWQISLGVLAAVLIGTVFRYLELSGGGRKVAEWAGATPIDMNTRQPEQKQFINICEEMSIAAGMPVPELYVMTREPGINAFVAGFTTEQAVLVVTKGALDRLTRDQLQGVIGHEYSHILNGDMRLNIRLMSFLAGLIMIGQIGRFLIQTGLHSGHSRRYSSSRNDRSGLAWVGMGVLFAAVGYIGVLVGRIIKAAVSRQREFLADASSVQFTRNPDGLAGALYEINAYSEGSQLLHRHAEDMSHFCFGETVALSQKLATHPPIQERIRRINPNFMAKERTRRRQTESADDSVQRSMPQPFETMLAVGGIASMVGQVTPDAVVHARRLYRHIPEQVKNWVHQSDGARAYLYCQVMLGSGDQRQWVLDVIKKDDSSVVPTLQRFWPFCEKMDEQLRLPILELALSTLKRMGEADRVIFLDRLTGLVELDGHIDFVEWITMSLVRLRLSPTVNPPNARLNSRVEPFHASIRTVFQVLVELNSDKAAALQMLQVVCDRMGLPSDSTQSDLSYIKLGESLAELDTISFMWRKVILQSCADIIQSDGKVSVREYDLLRVVSECLACPLPPIMIADMIADERDQLIPFN